LPNEAPFLVPFTAVLVAIVVHLSRKIAAVRPGFYSLELDLVLVPKALPDCRYVLPAHQ